MKYSHCFELYQEITKCESIKTVSCHFTADGLEAVVQDKFDEQEYVLTIKPKN